MRFYAALPLSLVPLLFCRFVDTLLMADFKSFNSPLSSAYAEKQFPKFFHVIRASPRFALRDLPSHPSSLDSPTITSDKFKNRILISLVKLPLVHLGEAVLDDRVFVGIDS